MTSVARELGTPNAGAAADALWRGARDAVVAALARRLDRVPEPAGTTIAPAALEPA
jgi:hypothetical protein